MQTTFEEDNLVANAGLAASAALAQRLGLPEIIDERVTLPPGAVGRAHCGVKAMTVVGAMLAGGDSIEDTAVLRTGAALELFDQTRAPSTIGAWLRGFSWGTVRKMDSANREMLEQAW
jgi:hypothetical protein